MDSPVWRRCLPQLERLVSPQDFQTWIRPLQCKETPKKLSLLAPNRFIFVEVQQRFLEIIQKVANEISPQHTLNLDLSGQRNSIEAGHNNPNLTLPLEEGQRSSNLNKNYTFDSFVEGKSNQLALAACHQVARNPGKAYNPLFIYGGTGLGKTHLMHAVGNILRQRKSQARVVYQHSEHFVSDMVLALQHNAIGDFKRYYRSLDALLIDDIQFLSGKEHSQEEFFHTFNNLLEGQQQVILTCDRVPKEVVGLEDRLKSRFGSGLTVAIEPPDLETRVAILKAKAAQADLALTDEIGFFIAKRVRSNVRELEGALRRVYAQIQFTQQPLTLSLVREALSDLMPTSDQQVTIETIQKSVANYYRISVNDLMADSRVRLIARRRQLAMALAKELTDHSLPEIAEAFGKRDHTTVLHACRQIDKLRKLDLELNDDYITLLTSITL